MFSAVFDVCFSEYAACLCHVVTCHAAITMLDGYRHAPMLKSFPAATARMLHTW